MEVKKWEYIYDYYINKYHKFLIIKMIQIIIFTILIVVIQNNPLENMNGIDYDLVRLLDTSQKNFLFRTVKPFNHAAFLYDDLVASMKRRA